MARSELGMDIVVKSNTTASALDHVGNKLGTLSKNTKKATQSFAGFQNVLGTVALVGFGRQLAIFTKSAMDMIEVTNLFGVSLGDMTEKANETVTALSSAFGMDTTNLQSAIGNYALLARSMGMASTQAEVLGSNTTKLAIDLSSLTNVPIEQVLQDLRSGLVGQSETVYKYGLDVTEAGLKAEAMAMGIDKSVRNMTQGEKMALRYSTMLRQATLAQGDFARTINTPSNQLKILTEQITTLSRALGSVFIPMLSAVLPYINGFVMMLIQLASALASFFGFKAPTFPKVTSSIGSVTSGAEEATKAVGGTSSAVKKLKQALMGFDEINLLPQQPDPASGGGGGGSAGGDGGSILDGLDLKGYDNMMSGVVSRTKELAEAMKKPFISLLKTVALVGAGILGWKIAWKAVDMYTDPMLGRWLAKLTAIKSMDMAKISSAFGSVSLIIAGIASVIAIVILRTTDLIAKNEGFRNGLSAIFDGFVAIGRWIDNSLIPSIGYMFSLLKLPQPFLDAMKALNIDSIDLLLTLGGIALLFTPAGAFGVAILVFEALTLAIRAIGHATDPSVKKMNELGSAVSDVTKEKVMPLIDSFDEAQMALDDLYYKGDILSQADVDLFKSRIDQLVNVIVEGFNEDKIKKLKALQSMRNFLTTEQYEKEKKDLIEFYDGSVKKTEEYGTKMNEIAQKSLDEHGKITEKARDEIRALEAKTYDVGLVAFTATQKEREAILKRSKDNELAVEIESASKLLIENRNNYIKRREEIEADYKELKDMLQDRLATEEGFTQEHYDKLLEQATGSYHLQKIQAGNGYGEINNSIYEKLGEQSKYIDVETGKIKNVWSTHFGEVKTDLIKTNNSILGSTSQFGLDYKTSLGNSLDSANATARAKLNVLADYFNKFKNIRIGTTGNSDINTALGNILGVSVTGVPRLARGGTLERGSLFEAGEFGKAELVGSFNNKTTVMPLENSGFVTAMGRAVYGAVVSAMGQGGGDSGDLILQVGETEFGRVAVKSINKLSKQEGKLALNI